jgi:hypothetical protein
MRVLRAFLWAWVTAALLAAVVIGTLRIHWEEGTRQLELAVDLGDAQGLIAHSHESLNDLLQALKTQGASALVIDPAQITDLRATWPELAASAPLDEPALMDWPTLVALRRSGWVFIWKLESPTDWNISVFSAYLMKLAELSPQAYLPIDWGPEPLQSPEILHPLRATLDRTSASLILLEFHDYTPAAALYRQGFTLFLRAHTISVTERQQLGEAASIARFERAAIERRVRLLYLHLSEQTVGDASAMISTLSTGLRAYGFRPGDLVTDSPPQTGWPIVALLFAGTAALFTLTLDLIWTVPSAILTGLWLVLVGLELLAFVTDAILARQLSALIIAIQVPVSTFVIMSRLREQWASWRESGSAGFIWVVAFSLGALLGGLLSSAILSDLPFYEGLYTFRGVKLALVLPILAILALYAGHTLRAGSIRWRMSDLLLGAGVAATLILVLLRSGNDSLLPVSGLEVQMRGLLESFFYVRPRFKEFLIGHPALFLWVAWGAPRFAVRSWALLALGMLGPVSIVNTYEHLHTPLALSLERTAIGLALGLALGWVLWRAVRRMEIQWHPAK